CANWLPGKVVFFQRDQYVSYDVAADHTDAGYPRPIPAEWFGRQSSEQLGTGRQNMLNLINKWMPTSLLNPSIPDGETEDLMAKAGWTKAKGQSSKKVTGASATRSQSRSSRARLASVCTSSTHSRPSVSAGKRERRGASAFSASDRGLK